MSRCDGFAAGIVRCLLFFSKVLSENKRSVKSEETNSGAVENKLTALPASTTLHWQACFVPLIKIDVLKSVQSN